MRTSSSSGTVVRFPPEREKNESSERDGPTSPPPSGQRGRYSGRYKCQWRRAGSQHGIEIDLGMNGMPVEYLGRRIHVCVECLECYERTRVWDAFVKQAIKEQRERRSVCLSCYQAFAGKEPWEDLVVRCETHHGDKAT